MALASTVTILDEEHVQCLGDQLQAILQKEKTYQIDLIAGRPIDVEQVLERLPQVAVVVLPESQVKAEKLLTKLAALGSGLPLLPVVKAEALSKMFDHLSAWAKDFLVTPLCEIEVLARVRMLLSRSTAQTGDRAIERVTENVGLAQLIGEDPTFLSLKRKLPLAAKSESTVLLTGETGTGKEKFARALHYLSLRADKPFLPVNCGAIPVDLFESELYGHRKGAFTSASADHAGLVAEAEGGTLFLDEIETLSLVSQAKFLRFLDDQSYYPVGCARSLKADVRIIASTNVDLSQKVCEGSFRDDLFYRLAVITLALPPLRLRRSDIPLLAAHFWKVLGDRHGGSGRKLSPRTIEALCGYSWPGNIRELANVVQRLMILTSAQIIEPDELPLEVSIPSPAPVCGSFKQQKARAMAEFEKAYLTELLRIHRGNITRAATEAQKERRSLGRLIKKYRISTR